MPMLSFRVSDELFARVEAKAAELYGSDRGARSKGCVAALEAWLGLGSNMPAPGPQVSHGAGRADAFRLAAARRAQLRQAPQSPD